MLHALEPSEPPDQTFDIIVCGSGSSGSVVARRLSDNPNINLLLIESGGMKFTETIRNAVRWPENIGTAEDWGFVSEPVAGLNGRSLLMSMGKVVGGSSSINAMIWARGHRSDWDYYASESGDAAWGYDAIQKLYRSIEDYRGASDTRRGNRGASDCVSAEPTTPDRDRLASGRRVLRNSPVREPKRADDGGTERMRDHGYTRDGRERMSIFDSYLRPVFGRSNLTILTGGTVERVVLEKGRAVGVDVVEGRKRHHFRAAQHVVLSTGSINTPRILMQSGIGPEAELRRLGIQTAQHLPGVGENLQDHICFPSIFEYREPMEPRGNGSAATVYAAVNAESTSPDVLVCQGEFPICSPEIAMKHSVPPHAWSLVAGLARPRSRGRVRLRSADPRERVLLELNSLSDPDDLKPPGPPSNSPNRSERKLGWAN